MPTQSRQKTPAKRHDLHAFSMPDNVADYARPPWRNLPGSASPDRRIKTKIGFFSRRLLHALTRRYKKIVIPDNHVIARAEVLANLRDLGENDSLTWIGHSTFLIHLDHQWILTDPIFASKASPLRWIGPTRSIAPALLLNDLPPIDTILISHNHYDHLCRDTLAVLAKRQATKVVAPQGLAPFFDELGYRHIHQLTWYHHVDAGPVRLRSLPAIHWSARLGLGGKGQRTLNPSAHRNHTLWMSCAISSSKRLIYFSGDSDFHPHLFQDLGQRLPRCDIALMAIGAYAPRNFMRGAHMTPEEAIKAAQQLGAKVVVPHHWGTISLSNEPFFEPLSRFIEAGSKARNIQPKPLAIGQTLALD